MHEKIRNSENDRKRRYEKIVIVNTQGFVNIKNLKLNYGEPKIVLSGISRLT